MMKMMRKAAAILMCICLAAFLAACGGSKKEETTAAGGSSAKVETKKEVDLSGTYPLYAVTEGEYSLLASDIMENGESYLKLEKGGKGEIAFDDVEEITWKQDGEKLVISSKSIMEESAEAEYKDGIITLTIPEDDDAQMILYFASEGADTSWIEVTTLEELLGSMLEEELGDLDTDLEDALETAGASALDEDSDEFWIKAYDVNGQIYDDPSIIESMGMSETYLVMNDDNTATLCISGQPIDVRWTDKGEILIAGTPTYSFEIVDDNHIDLKLTQDIIYKLERGHGNASASTAVKETEAETEEEIEETEAETEKETEKQTEAAADTFKATPNEPIAKGDGKGASKDAVLKLMKYWSYMDSTGVKLSYEDMVEIVGVEGKDGGNKGANSMTKYGDRMVTWYIDDSSYVYYTFRRPDDKDEWTARQWMSQNIDRASWENADISDLLPKADPSTYVANSFEIKAFMTDIVTKVSVKIPPANWTAVKDKDTTIVIYNGDGSDRNAPRTKIEVQSTLERIDFYKDQFENLKDIENRTISGIDMKGRTYKNIGTNWTEWYGELPNGCWISINTTKMDITDGSEIDEILKTIEVK